MRVAGGADRRLEPNVSKKSCSNNVLQQNAPLQQRRLSCCLVKRENPTCANWPKPIVLFRARSRNSSLLCAIRSRMPSVLPSGKLRAVGAFGADYIANILMQEQSARDIAAAVTFEGSPSERTGDRSSVPARI